MKTRITLLGGVWVYVSVYVRTRRCTRIHMHSGVNPCLVLCRRRETPTLLSDLRMIIHNTLESQSIHSRNGAEWKHDPYPWGTLYVHSSPVLPTCPPASGMATRLDGSVNITKHCWPVSTADDIGQFIRMDKYWVNQLTVSDIDNSTQNYIWKINELATNLLST